MCLPQYAEAGHILVGHGIWAIVQRLVRLQIGKIGHGLFLPVSAISLPTRCCPHSGRR
jgi:hypothetical protein